MINNSHSQEINSPISSDEEALANEVEDTNSAETQFDDRVTTTEDSHSLSEDSPTPDSESDTIEMLQQENAHLKKLLDESTEQFKTLKQQHARLGADFDNFRKRTAKEKETLQEQSKKSVIAQLLPVVDNFERARVSISPSNEGEITINKSYQGVYKTLVNALKKMGVSPMRPEGEQFDPNFHEAMLREPTNEKPEGTVLEQLMMGYMFGNTVLRHAMVKVAVPSEPVITSEEEEEKTEDSANN